MSELKFHMFRNGQIESLLAVLFCLGFLPMNTRGWIGFNPSRFACSSDCCRRFHWRVCALTSPSFFGWMESRLGAFVLDMQSNIFLRINQLVTITAASIDFAQMDSLLEVASQAAHL